jgi:transglutaminase-like putative cysteine protease
MLYDVRLRMGHDYDRPAAAGRHLVRVTPRTIPGRQRVIAVSLGLEPQPAERSDRADFFGNATTAIAYRDDHMHFSFNMSARVAVDQPTKSEGSADIHEMKRDLAEHRSLEPDSPHHFLSASPMVAIEGEIADYARQSAGDRIGVAAIANDLTRRIHADFAYDGGATDVRTAPLTAFRLRRGVCQDFTHVMIAGLRGLGIPAAYVSGYLRTIPPPGREKLEGADAMHAWVRVWCGEKAGWLEFDPTNAMRGGEDHIIAGIGRDYSDVAPVSGVMRTLGEQAVSQAVDVIPIS